MKGQAIVETLVGMGTLILLGVGAVALMLSCLGKILLTKFAEENSRCVAQIEDSVKCTDLTRLALSKHFHFHKIDVSEKILQGIIHTHIEARMLGKMKLKANFDLQPSEYKRVK